MEWVKENKKIVALGAGLIATLGLGYYLLKEEKVGENNQDEQKQEQQTSNTTQQQQQSSSQNAPAQQQTQQQQVSSNFGFTGYQPSFVNDPKYQAKLSEMVQKIQSTPGWSKQIDIQSLSIVLESSVEIYGIFFAELTKEQRKVRRAKTGQDYLNCIKEQVNVIEQDLNFVQEVLIKELGFSSEEFEQGVQQIAMMGYQQQLIMIDMATKQMLKGKIPSDQGVDKEKAKEILRFQLEVIKNQKDEFLQNILKIITIEEFSRVSYYTNFLLIDKIYDKFGIEEEDVNHMIPSQQHIDEEIMKLMQEFEMQMQNFMMSLQQSMPQGGGMF